MRARTLRGSQFAWLIFVLTLLTVHPAMADIYGFTDAHGVLHLNDFRVDERYQVLLRHSRPTEQPVAEQAPSSTPGDYRAIVETAARKFQLSPALLHAVITVESAYNPRAMSRKGALGLMQLMPETAQRYGVSDRRDAAENVRGGAHYLRDLLRLFDNDVRLALAAYNAGEAAVLRYGGAIPPFSETRSYVERVIALYTRSR